MGVLSRLEASRFSVVSNGWAERTAVIVASGPSLVRADVSLVGARRAAGAIRCIAVNASYLWAPFADVCYFADSHFWRWQEHGVPYPGLGMNADDVRRAWAGFAGQKCTIENSGANVADDAVHMLKNKEGMGLSRDPQVLVSGRNSGFQALNLAVLAGATRIVLLGFDGKPGEQGRDHFHGGHPRPTPKEAFPLYRQAMSAAENALLEMGVEVINCSPGSAIDSFPKARLEDVL